MSSAIALSRRHVSVLDAVVFLGASPANSGTADSVFFDESAPQTITVQELTTPETIKLDLLIQTKTLGGKVLDESPPIRHHRSDFSPR